MALPVPQKWPQCQCGNFFIFGVFWKCLYTFLYMYTHFVMSSRLLCIPVAYLSLKMALPVPQKWPQCQCGNYIKKGFYCERFLECFGSVYCHIFIHVPCLSLKNGPNVNVVIFLYQKGVLL